MREQCAQRDMFMCLVSIILCHSYKVIITIIPTPLFLALALMCVCMRACAPDLLVLRHTSRGWIFAIITAFYWCVLLSWQISDKM